MHVEMLQRKEQQVSDLMEAQKELEEFVGDLKDRLLTEENKALVLKEALTHTMK